VPRTVIVGGPKCGKTTRAVAMGGDIISTDGFASAGDFSAQSEAAAKHLGGDGDWVLEGVTAVRALRKWLRTHDGKPCDVVVNLTTAYQPLSPGQQALGKGCQTVLREITPELRKRGVELL